MRKKLLLPGLYRRQCSMPWKLDSTMTEFDFASDESAPPPPPRAPPIDGRKLPPPPVVPAVRPLPTVEPPPTLRSSPPLISPMLRSKPGADALCRSPPWWPWPVDWPIAGAGRCFSLPDLQQQP